MNIKLNLLTIAFFLSTSLFSETMENNISLSQDQMLILAYEKAEKEGVLNSPSETFGDEQMFFKKKETKTSQYKEKTGSTLEEYSNLAMKQLESISTDSIKEDSSKFYDNSIKFLKESVDSGIEKTKNLASTGVDSSKTYVKDWFKRTWEESKREVEKNKREAAAKKIKKQQNDNNKR